MGGNFFQAVSKSEKPFKFNAKFINGTLILNAFQDFNAWEGEADKDALAVSAEIHKINVEEYCQKLENYFRESPQDVEFKLSRDKFIVNLVLKNNMKMLFFSLDLKKVDFPNSVFNLIDNLYFEKAKYFTELNEEQKKCLDLEKSKREYETKLVELIQRKHTEESELYNKFIAILNEKKLHIQHLNDLLNAFRRGRPTVNPTRDRPITQKKNKKKEGKKVAPTPAQISDDSEDSSRGYNTDDEIKNENKGASMVPSISNEGVNFLMEDDLIHATLPKRVKTVSNLDCNKCLEEPKDSKMEVLEGPSKLDNIKNSSATIFNTQDLLDGI